MELNLRGYIKKINEKKHRFDKKRDGRLHSTNVLSEKTSFAIREAYKSARTNIIFALAGVPGSRKVIFTSSEPGEGKSTTSLNVAISFAQTGAKVILVDCDLRKPRIHRYMGVERKNGISDLLVGLIDINSAIHHHDEYNIDFIPAGQIPPNPVELLSSNAMEGLMSYLGDRYDYIFIDTPPVTTVADAASMSNFVDGYIIIIRHNYTIHEFLEKTVQNLEFADGKILGFVMNDMKPMLGLGYGKYGAYKNRYRYNYRYRYGYKYGYKYGYDYGYSYSENEYGDAAEIKEGIQAVEHVVEENADSAENSNKNTPEIKKEKKK